MDYGLWTTDWGGVLRLAALMLGTLAAPSLAEQASGAQVRIESVTLDKPVVEQFSRVELTIQTSGVVKNPYDPEELAIEARFDPPRGAPIVVPAFYYQPFELVVEGGRETLRPSGSPVWKVRFTPRLAGVWSYVVTAKARENTQAIEGRGVEVVRSNRKGFVRVDGATQAFRFETGEPFIPIGENMAWAPERQLLRAYEGWLRELVANRGNFIRLWLAPWALRLETEKTGAGTYDQERAWKLDALLQRSEALGVYWQLCLLEHGSFSRTQDPEWQRNPYNEELGGVCRLPGDFLQSQPARRLFRRLLRYLVSRWGYSPHLASWELFNEVDLSELDVQAFGPWAQEMSGYLRELDYAARPITVSFHKAKPEAVWKLPTIDVVQVHLYDQRDFAEAFCGSAIREPKAAFGKPVMVGEFGWITENVRQIDQGGIHLHDGLWASVMAGAISAALPWYWDVYIEPHKLQRHFRPLAQYWRGEELPRGQPPLTLSLSDGDLLGCGIGTRDRAFLWIKNRTHSVDQYLAYRAALAKERLRGARGQAASPVRYPPRLVTGARAAASGPGWSGTYQVEWWDPYEGRPVMTHVARADRGRLVIDVPDVEFDLAAKLSRLPWWKNSP